MKLDEIFHKHHELKPYPTMMKANGAIVMNRPLTTDPVDRVQLVHQENLRLQQQLLLEREYYASYRQGQRLTENELVQTNKDKKDLERKVRLFRSLKEAEKRHPASLQNKIQILLNELESMEIEESRLFSQLSFQKDECQDLKIKLESKEQEIKQLMYELQIKK
ncbi:hypothetical protein BY458DRAFT_507341 [Sporodiniella umbellata]|nr:hypothetical protein BY458DRAFT_507341 [Sporodiniella umbellata]